jgi:hypothetical protein
MFRETRTDSKDPMCPSPDGPVQESGGEHMGLVKIYSPIFARHITNLQFMLPEDKSATELEY